MMWLSVEKERSRAGSGETQILLACQREIQYSIDVPSPVSPLTIFAARPHLTLPLYTVIYAGGPVANASGLSRQIPHT